MGGLEGVSISGDSELKNLEKNASYRKSVGSTGKLPKQPQLEGPTSWREKCREVNFDCQGCCSLQALASSKEAAERLRN